MVAGCAKVVIPKAPAVKIDLMRIELFYAGLLDPNLYYIVAVNRSGLASAGHDPKAFVSGPDIAKDWTDALIYHQGFWRYYTANDIRLHNDGSEVLINPLNTTLHWDSRVQNYLANFGLQETIHPPGGGKLTLELCKTFFSVPAGQQSANIRCQPATGATPTNPTISFNFFVSPLQPDPVGNFGVLDAMETGIDFQIRQDADQSPASLHQQMDTPNINLTGHNSPYVRPDLNTDNIPDDINQVLGAAAATDTDHDSFPDAVEVSMDTDPNNAASVPLSPDLLPVTLQEVWHPADLTWWRLRQVVPGQQ